MDEAANNAREARIAAPADAIPGDPAVPPSPLVAPLNPELAARLAALEQERLRQEKWRAQVWRERRALLVLLAFVLLCLPNFRMARVVGRSMEPQFKQGDPVVVLKTWRWFSPLKPGDIIVFRLEGQELIKRVVFVQNPQHTARWPDSVQTSRGPVPVRPEFFLGGVEQLDRVPSGPNYRQRSVYVLGDNFDLSDDSRRFGPIAPENILGKVLLAP
jgi:signal peptidase I